MTIHDGRYTTQQVIDAMIKARGDRDRLARLRKAGRVQRRDGEFELRHPEIAKPFIRDIEDRNRSTINLAIRPKKRKKR